MTLKKTAFIALLAVGGVAQAQSNVTVYGIADAAIVVDNGGTVGRLVKVGSGAASVSRIGFKGLDDIGNGLQAYFTLETGTKIDTGELDSANTIFNRQAFVGLRGGFGAVALGRQYTTFHTTLVNVADPFGTGYAGTTKNLFPDWGTNVRMSNVISYAPPKWGPVDAEVFYSAGEQSTISAGRQYGGALGYADGPVTVRLAYNAKNSDVVGPPAVNHDIGRNILLGANYNFGWFKLYAAYCVDKGFNSAPLGNTGTPFGGIKPTPSTNGRDALIGFNAPLGSGLLMFSIQHKDDRSSYNQDASEAGIGYLYSLSKRSGLYVAAAHIRNQHGAGYVVSNNTEAGTGNTGYNLGIRHTF